MRFFRSSRALAIVLLLLVASAALSLWQFFRAEPVVAKNTSQHSAPHALSVTNPVSRHQADNRSAGPLDQGEEAPEPNDTALPPDQRSVEALVFGVNGMTSRDAVYGEPHGQVSQQRLREIAKMPVSQADRFQIQARLRLPGDRMMDLGTVELAPGQRATIERIKDFPFPTSVVFAQASETPQPFQPGSSIPPTTPPTPPEWDARTRGLQIDIDVTPAPGALVLGGSVKHTVLEGYGRMPGEAFLPVVDTENTLLNDNKVLQPQFTTRESPFLAAATAGEVAAPFHDTAL